MMGMKVKPSSLREIIEEIDEDVVDSLNSASFVSWPPGSSSRRMRRHSKRSSRRLSGSMTRRGTVTSPRTP